MGSAIVFLIAGFVLLIVFGFWIYMLIVAIRDEKEYEKIAWVIVIVFTHIFGALIYCFYRIFDPRKKAR